MSGKYYPNIKEQWSGGEMEQKQLQIEFFSLIMFIVGMFYWAYGAMGVVQAILNILICFTGFIGAWKKILPLLYVFMACMFATVIIGIVMLATSVLVSAIILAIVSIAIDCYAIYVCYTLVMMIRNEGTAAPASATV